MYKKVYGHDLDSNQVILMKYLGDNYAEAIRRGGRLIKVPFISACAIESSGLYEIFDIQLGYSDDDFIKGVKSVLIGYGCNQVFLSKMICSESDYVEYTHNSSIVQFIEYALKERNQVMIFDFHHVDYNAEREILTITSFFKLKNK